MDYLLFRRFIFFAYAAFFYFIFYELSHILIKLRLLLVTQI